MQLKSEKNDNLIGEFINIISTLDYTIETSVLTALIIVNAIRLDNIYVTSLFLYEKNGSFPLHVSIICKDVVDK